MWNVWRTVLEENEKLARARLAAVEVFQQQIADEAKFLRQHKLNVAKKVGMRLSLSFNWQNTWKKIMFLRSWNSYKLQANSRIYSVQIQVVISYNISDAKNLAKL